jgi:hypothetical protein
MRLNFHPALWVTTNPPSSLAAFHHPITIHLMLIDGLAVIATNIDFHFALSIAVITSGGHRLLLSGKMNSMPI